MLDPAVAGLATGLSLIVAIGAQNAFVLRQGLRREHVGVVVLICAASDVVLITAGVTGIGAVVEHASWVLTVVRWLGVAFLTWYGVTTLARAGRSESLRAADGQGVPTPVRVVAGRATALTWLNPHVYLDTVLLLGTVANHQGPTGRWWFALGACAGSVVWFTGLGYGARLAGRVLARPATWRVLDVLIGLTMLGIALSLATSS